MQTSHPRRRAPAPALRCRERPRTGPRGSADPLRTPRPSLAHCLLEVGLFPPRHQTHKRPSHHTSVTPARRRPRCWGRWQDGESASKPTTSVMDRLFQIRAEQQFMRSKDRHAYTCTGECARHARICGFLYIIPLARGRVIIPPSSTREAGVQAAGGPCWWAGGGWRRGRSSGAEVLVDGVDVPGGVDVAGGIEMAWGELPVGWAHSPRAQSLVGVGTFLSCKQMLEFWAFGGRWVGSDAQREAWRDRCLRGLQGL